jgi:hypothetical protein
MRLKAGSELTGLHEDLHDGLDRVSTEVVAWGRVKTYLDSVCLPQYRCRG